MTNNLKLTVFAFLILCIGAVSGSAQKNPVSKNPDYKITNIKIVPFDSYKGEFQEEIKTDGEPRSFFNDYAISLMVVVEVSVEKEGYEQARAVQITVTEGKKLKKTKTEPMVPMEANGKYYVPVWLEAGMCDSVKITAKITGQKTLQTTTRTVLFQCGE